MGLRVKLAVLNHISSFHRPYIKLIGILMLQGSKRADIQRLQKLRTCASDFRAVGQRVSKRYGSGGFKPGKSFSFVKACTRSTQWLGHG